MPSPRVCVDAYVLDTLMADLVGHDRTPAAFVVYLYLWKESRRSRRRVRVSHAGVSGDTGLSKSAVQAAIRLLKRRQLLRSFRGAPTAIPEYEVLRPWARRGAPAGAAGSREVPH